MKSHTVPLQKHSSIRPRLGIIGGGQLARMTALAAAPLGCEVHVLERVADCPAAVCSAQTHVGDWSSLDTLLHFASQVDLLTVENEFVDASLLRLVERAGHRVHPGSECLAVIQDKFLQKRSLALAGLPVPAFAGVATQAEVLAFAREHGFPVVLKSRLNGYDGKGNATVRTLEELPQAWALLSARGGGLLVEAYVPFQSELAVQVIRGLDGQTAVYPVVESIQGAHICRSVLAPARLPVELAREAQSLALRAAAVFGGQGCFAVELFLGPEGRLLVNELAPRVHNSGHYTLDGCVCSQFENHVRAILGLPLGDPRMTARHAAMVNVLGSRDAGGSVQGLSRALAHAGALVHLYGKTRSAPGRKMGHVTVLGDTAEDCMAQAHAAAACLGFGDGVSPATITGSRVSYRDGAKHAQPKAFHDTLTS